MGGHAALNLVASDFEIDLELGGPTLDALFRTAGDNDQAIKVVGSTSLEKIDVFGDGAPISRDTTHANGYDYTDGSMQSIQVYGPLCGQIMSGAIRDVTVTFRCVVT